ncbi:hypothetical protein AVEN_120695-1 [Araneus ventricosus]|uniref:Tc1-like transposase DDE domain-containing protein n=1 Tax=Araneus ventricosus TaxID=182803 RepID=A0A4Y2V3X9_ARAVE|nr:hypothetical protein AVEN_120695-1 [Araneus ventricosus]
MWFMQDGATPHRTNEVFDLLDEHFNERIVALGHPKSKYMGIDWPPYSPDLNPCYSFLWGYIKDKVYAENPQSTEDLKTAIQTVIVSIETSTLQRVMQNFAFRLRHIIAIDGRHIEHGYLLRMIRHYVRKSDRANASSETMKAAVLEMKLKKKSIRRVALQYGIHRNTLTRYCIKYEELVKSPDQSSILPSSVSDLPGPI